jgi:diguanylate cyclase
MLELTDPVPAPPGSGEATHLPVDPPARGSGPGDRLTRSGRAITALAVRARARAAFGCATACAVGSVVDAARPHRVALLAAAAFFIAGAWVATTNQHAHEVAWALRLARTDDLTGLANRRALIDDLENDLPTGKPLALLMLDLDGFKAVNDAHGHQAGNEVLIALADRLRAGTAPDARPVRVGGDEFAALMPTDDPIILRRRALSLRADLGRPVPTYAGDVAVQVSIGIGIRTHADTTPGDLLHRADLAMYQAKRGAGIV